MTSLEIKNDLVVGKSGSIKLWKIAIGEEYFCHIQFGINQWQEIENVCKLNQICQCFMSPKFLGKYIRNPIKFENAAI